MPGEVFSGEPFGSFFITPNEASDLNYSDTEWRRYQEKAATEIPGLTRSSPQDQGPQITVHKPQHVKFIEDNPTMQSNSPLDLLVVFEKNNAPVDIQSLEVRAQKGFFKKSLTDRLRPFINENIINAESLKIPSGKFLIVVSISDTQGRKTVKKYQLEVSKD